MTVPPFRFRPDIEGLRAVAILLVVGHHVRLPFFQGGFVGVDVFFVLSGYLITWLLVREAEGTGRVDFARFYARRARRLVPALAVVVVATVGATAALYAPFEQAHLGRFGAAAAMYGSNLLFGYVGQDYFAPRVQENPFLHTWSLGVEEQFYLVWPLVIAGAAGLLGRGRARPLLWLGGLTALSVVASVALTAAAPKWAYYASPTRAWQFGAGGLAVLLPLARWETARCRDVLGWAGLVGLAVATGWFSRATPYPGLAAALPTLSTVALLRAEAVASGTTVGRALSLPPMREVGRLSYSWYLWHWPLLVVGASSVPKMGGLERIAAVAVALALAKGTYHWVEAPARSHPALVGHPRRSLVWALAVTGVVAGLSLGWGRAAEAWAEAPRQAAITATIQARSRVYKDRCTTSTVSAELRDCAYGASTAPRTAVLVGDSQAGTWFPMLTPLIDSGEWRVTVMVKLACPFVDVPHHSRYLGRRDRPCEAWRRAATARIEALTPDLVVVATNTYYNVPASEWPPGLARAVAPLAAASQRVVLLGGFLNPRYDVPACLGRRAWHGGRFPRCADADRTAGVGEPAVAQAADRWAHVHLFDLTPFLCGPAGCPVERDGRPVYKDGHHVADWVPRQAAPAFAAAVDSLSALAPAR